MRVGKKLIDSLLTVSRMMGANSLLTVSRMMGANRRKTTQWTSFTPSPRNLCLTELSGIISILIELSWWKQKLVGVCEYVPFRWRRNGELVIEENQWFLNVEILTERGLIVYCIPVWISTDLCVCVCVCARAWMHACVRVCVCACVCVCVLCSVLCRCMGDADTNANFAAEP